MLISQAESLLTLPKSEEIPSSSSPNLVTDATNCPDCLVVTLQNVKQNDCFRPTVSFQLSGRLIKISECLGIDILNLLWGWSINIPTDST